MGWCGVMPMGAGSLAGEGPEHDRQSIHYITLCFCFYVFLVIGGLIAC